jgi:hypothetical protein
MAEAVRIEHGATTMPIVRNEPDGDRRADVPHGVDDRGQGADAPEVPVGLLGDRALAGLVTTRCVATSG